MRDANVDVVRRIEPAWAKGDLDALDDLIAADYTPHTTGSDQIPAGLQGAKMAHQLAIVPDMRGETLRMVVSGNKVAIQCRATGTDSGTGFGAMKGAPATGKPFTAETINVLTVSDDLKFTEHYGIFDVTAVIMQLGLLPAEG